ncbi:hypothetical protein C474_00065 [Halogeometricum pallidum JCM 14848]|uniref:Divalent heavy-metal cations transporter n=1 Tax=Halogeometricum pallidum JCM 14848 TaxID=1227487 RepID=M0DKQ0_HALPD|nr:hypothetical protein [Halogeometricum pallidum]ELZ35297.1 hypothetical protein C474_00065 [Halogeometricum pallidum JCM 14848]
MFPTLGVLCAVAFAAVHVFAGKLRFLRAVPRSRWLSAAGGVSVAYVFVHVFPEITEHHARLTEGPAAASPLLATLTEHAVFLATLAGFTAFYGLEQFARRSGSARDGGSGSSESSESSAATGAFWVHVGSFAAYNGLVGYLLLHREEAGAASLLLYAVAMAVHFVVTDYGLRDHHRDTYDRVGRWVLAAAAPAGVGVGFFVDVPEAVLSLLFAFLAGGIVLNVIKEELPEERESRFWTFAAGLVGYTVVLLVV